MKKSHTERSRKQRTAHAKKKSYEKPMILSIEKLEVVAAVCNTKDIGVAQCVAAGPPAS